mgnify:CR=1 FL=1
MIKYSFIFYRSEIESIVDKHYPTSFDSARYNIIKSLNKLGKPSILIFNYPFFFKWHLRPRWGKNIKLLPFLNIKFMSYLSKNFILVLYWLYIIIFKKADVIVTDLGGVLSLLPVILIKKIFSINVILNLDIRSMSVEIKNEHRVTFNSIITFISLKIASKYFESSSFITEDLKKVIEKKYKLIFNNYFIWSSGVDTELFFPKFNQQIKPCFKIIYHGSISPTRGLEDLIRSLTILKKKNKNIKLVVLGASNDYNNFNEYFKKINYIVKELKLEDSVDFLPPVKHNLVPDIIRDCQLGVVPFHDKPWWVGQSPLKLLEYLACGLPTVVSDINCNRIIIADNPCGIYFKPEDIQDLATKIEQIYYEYYDYSHLYNSRRIKGYELVREFFTWNKQALKIISFFYN